jgi:biopolymer transport protein ExbB
MSELLDVRGLFAEAASIWRAGGWAMIALAVNGVILFAVGMDLFVKLQGRRMRTVKEKTWRRWIGRPEERRGPVGRIIGFAMGATDLRDLRVRFTELRGTEIAPFARDLKFMNRAVSTAPLLGLLGTVTGMLTTFRALAEGSGGQKTMDMVAGGISEALITTETGLLIALPGLIFTHYLSRQRDRHEALLAHVESACIQYMCVWSEIGERAGEGPASGRPGSPGQEDATP